MSTYNTHEEIRAAQNDDDGYITGRIEIELADVIERNLEEFYDMLSYRLVASDLLMDIDYEVIEVNDGAIVLDVTGDPRQLLTGYRD
jgi:hypothetical protein